VCEKRTQTTVIAAYQSVVLLFFIFLDFVFIQQLIKEELNLIFLFRFCTGGLQVDFNVEGVRFI